MGKGRNEGNEVHVTDIKALKDNAAAAVEGFTQRWVPMPRFGIGVEVMDVRQLRDAMGLRATIEAGDPWPAAERLLLQLNFCWHWLGGARVMFLKERDDFVPDTGWTDVE